MANKFILTILLICFVQVAYAKQYEIPELYLTINIPDEYYVITNKTNNEKIFKALNLDKEKLLKEMRDNNIYLFILDRNFKFDISVTGMVNNEKLQQIGDSINYPSLWEDPSYQKSFKKSAKNTSNNDITSFNSYSTDNALYYVASGTENVNGEACFVKHYQTIKNGILIGINARSLVSDKNIAERSQLSIVNSIHFTKSNNYPKPTSLSSNTSKNDNLFERSLSHALGMGILVAIFLFIKFLLKFIWQKIKHKEN